MGKRQSRLRPEEVEGLVKATHCELPTWHAELSFTAYTYLHPVTPKELNRW